MCDWRVNRWVFGLTFYGATTTRTAGWVMWIAPTAGSPTTRTGFRLTIINADGPFEPDAEAPAAVIALTPFNNAKIVPADDAEDFNQAILASPRYMFGGNYAACSDSRFNEAIKKLTGQDFYGAVPIHDRREW